MNLGVLHTYTKYGYDNFKYIEKNMVGNKFKVFWTETNEMCKETYVLLYIEIGFIGVSSKSTYNFSEEELRTGKVYFCE